MINSIDTDTINNALLQHYNIINISEHDIKYLESLYRSCANTFKNALLIESNIDASNGHVSHRIIDHFMTRNMLPCNKTFSTLMSFMRNDILRGIHGFGHKFLIDVMIRRFENYLDGLYKAVDVISLGETCLPRVIATRWGYKRSRALGELSMPFDLGVHPFESMPTLLENGFRGYTETENLEFIEEKQYAINKNYGILWNHDIGHDIATNNFHKLREIYLRRIKNFYACTTNNKRKIFFLHCSSQINSTNYHEIDRLSCHLSKICTNDFRLLVIATGESAPHPCTSHNVWIRHVPYHRKNYNWWEIPEYLTPEGLNFERQIHQALRQSISHLLLAAC